MVIIRVLTSLAISIIVAVAAFGAIAATAYKVLRAVYHSTDGIPETADMVIVLMVDALASLLFMAYLLSVLLVRFGVLRKGKAEILRGAVSSHRDR